MKKKQNAYYIRAPSLCLSSCKKPNKASPFVCDFALKDTFTIYHNHERHPRNIQKKINNTSTSTVMFNFWTKTNTKWKNNKLTNRSYIIIEKV